jgi:hypothetical protein
VAHVHFEDEDLMHVPRVSSLTILTLTILAACATADGQSQTPAANPSKAAAVKQPAPVIVELFTSEGCSSCPPADDLLTTLMRSQPVPGAQIIALGEHVDYWDRLGWRDQFSSPQFTARQNEYAQRAFHTDDIYTPQVIVNGEQQVLGSDARAVKNAIANAAQRQPGVALSLTIPTDATTDPRAATSVHVQLQANVAPGTKLDEPIELLVAVTEDGLGSHVLRGENSGRDLHHGTVLRTLVAVGTITAKNASWSGTKAVTLAKDWNPHQLHIVAIAQAQKSRRILGAAIAPLDRASQATASH